jgi:hypothetical protein
MRVEQRRRGMVEAVFRHRAPTRRQIEIAADFPLSRHTRAPRALTQLVASRALDRLPRSSVIDPAVYVLSRRSVLGNRLMRAQWGEDVFRRHLWRITSLDHLLAVNDVRVRIERACRDLGWNLVQSELPGDLQSRMTGTSGLDPDSYFCVARTVDGISRRAGLFLEVEKSVKAASAVERKLEKYVAFYRSGTYTREFGLRGLRVLVVFSNEWRGPAPSRVLRGLQSAERTGATFARFSSLDDITTAPPLAVVTSPIWRQPGRAAPLALFPPAADAPAARPYPVLSGWSLPLTEAGPAHGRTQFDLDLG